MSTAEELIKRNMKFIRTVKTATRKYTMSYLSSVEINRQFNHLTLVRKGNSGQIEMVALMSVDRDRRYFITTASTSVPSSIHKRERWRQTADGAKPHYTYFNRLKAIKMYYQTCSKVDQHNRWRQDDVNIEKKLQTQSWAIRVN